MRSRNQDIERSGDRGQQIEGIREIERSWDKVIKIVGSTDQEIERSTDGDH